MQMDLKARNCSVKATFPVMDDKDDHIPLRDDFGQIESLEIHLGRGGCKLP